MSQYFNQVSYGLTQGLITEAPAPILAKRAPTTHDIKWALGQLWIYVPGNLAYVLTSIVNNSANWLQIESSGGSGVFSSLTVTPGPVTLVGTTNINSTGAAATNIGNATGNTAVTGSMTISSNITSTTGDILASSGSVTAGVDVIAEAGVVEGVSLVATGDIGAGVGATTIFTSGSTAVSTGTGAFSLSSTTGAGTATNAGYLKAYLGTTVIYIPYFITTT